MTVARRLTAGFLASGMGQIWVVAIQVLTVPLLTLGWGGARYGAWLMISTIPTYVAIGSAGFGNEAAAI